MQRYFSLRQENEACAIILAESHQLRIKFEMLFQRYFDMHRIILVH